MKNTENNMIGEVPSFLKALDSGSNGLVAVWKNGKVGRVSILRDFVGFVSATPDMKRYIKEEYYNPIELADGFLFELLKRWKNRGLFFNEYYNRILEDYKTTHKNDTDAWNRNFEEEFGKIHYDSIVKSTLEDYPLFGYLNDDDVKELEGWQKQYVEWLNAQLGNGDVLKHNDGLTLPDELNTEGARIYFDKAISLRLMDENYKWLKGLQMLACFAREMSLKLSLGKGGRISWKPFEILFSIEKGKLRRNYNDIQKTGVEPIESRLIDEVFK